MGVLLFVVGVFGVMPWWWAIAQGIAHHQVTGLFSTLFAALCSNNTYHPLPGCLGFFSGVRLELILVDSQHGALRIFSI